MVCYECGGRYKFGTFRHHDNCSLAKGKTYRVHFKNGTSFVVYDTSPHDALTEALEVMSGEEFASMNVEE